MAQVGSYPDGEALGATVAGSPPALCPTDYRTRTSYLDPQGGLRLCGAEALSSVAGGTGEADLRLESGGSVKEYSEADRWTRSVVETAVDLAASVTGSGDALPNEQELMEWLFWRTGHGWEERDRHSSSEEQRDYDEAVRDMALSAAHLAEATFAEREDGEE